MSILKGQPIDPRGRAVTGPLPMTVPGGTEVENAARTTVENGIAVNRTKNGLDIYINGNRYTIAPNSINVENSVVMSNGDTITVTGPSIIPIDPATRSSVGTLALPVAPSVGDVVIFYDENIKFNKTTGVNINAKINGITTTYLFRAPGGYWELEYVGGGIGWIVESVDQPVILSQTAPAHTNPETKATFITRPGLYTCNCNVPDQVYYPPINDEKMSIGDEIVIFYDTGGNHNISITNNALLNVRNQHYSRYCGGAYVHYRLSPSGWFVLAQDYFPLVLPDMAAFNGILADNQKLHALQGQAVGKVDLSEWDYTTSGETMDGIFEPASYILFNFDLHTHWDPGKNSSVNGTATINYNKIRVSNTTGTTDFNIIFDRDGVGGGAFTTNYVDVGNTWSVRINDNATTRTMVRVSKELVLNVEKPNATTTIAGKENTFRPGDSIAIHVNKFMSTDSDIYTLQLGTDRFTTDDGTTTFDSVEVEGAGIAIIFKDDDGFWKYRHEQGFKAVTGFY